MAWVCGGGWVDGTARSKPPVALGGGGVLEIGTTAGTVVESRAAVRWSRQLVGLTEMGGDSEMIGDSTSGPSARGSMRDGRRIEFGWEVGAGLDGGVSVATGGLSTCRGLGRWLKSRCLDSGATSSTAAIRLLGRGGGRVLLRPFPISFERQTDSTPAAPRSQDPARGRIVALIGYCSRAAFFCVPKPSSRIYIGSVSRSAALTPLRDAYRRWLGLLVIAAMLATTLFAGRSFYFCVWMQEVSDSCCCADDSENDDGAPLLKGKPCCERKELPQANQFDGRLRGDVAVVAVPAVLTTPEPSAQFVETRASLASQVVRGWWRRPARPPPPRAPPHALNCVYLI